MPHLGKLKLYAYEAEATEGRGNIILHGEIFWEADGNAFHHQKVFVFRYNVTLPPEGIINSHALYYHKI